MSFMCRVACMEVSGRSSSSIPSMRNAGSDSCSSVWSERGGGVSCVGGGGDTGVGSVGIIVVDTSKVGGFFGIEVVAGVVDGDADAGDGAMFARG